MVPTFRQCPSTIAAALAALMAMVSPGAAEAPAPPAASSPGGAATWHGRIDARAFQHPSAALPPARGLVVRVGAALFSKLWVASPSSTTASDGLGPLFNARSCDQCPIRGGRGHPPALHWPDGNAVSMIVRLSVPPSGPAETVALAAGRIGAVPEPVYGTQLQDFSAAGLAAEGHLRVTWTEHPVALADGETESLAVPRYELGGLAYGAMHPAVMMSPRVAPPVIGLGLLEAVSDADILAWADPDDRDDDGISGRANLAWDATKGEAVLGRFGWKAAHADLRHQAAAAFSADMGLSTTLLPAGAGDCTALQPACATAPHGGSPGAGGVEVPDTSLDLVVLYLRHLAVPARRHADAPSVRDGERQFHAVGCAGCHRPSLTTGVSAEAPALSRQPIWPYSDLLLHDMGAALADHRPEGLADGREWRTPPLWGIGLTATVSGHTRLLHDGRARNLLEAILWHGGEAAAARGAVAALSRADRARLLAFLGSL